MTTTITVAEVIFDRDIYPRDEWSQATVNRYAESINAGDVFPPIVLEADTNRLLDGMHRWQAHKQALRDDIAVVWTEIPEGVPAKLYAASLSAKHGDRINGETLRKIARETTHANPDFNLGVLAKLCGVTRQTMSKWVGDIVERRRDVRRLAAVVLSRAGWSQRQIGDHLGIDQSTVMRDVNGDIAHHLTEELIGEAVRLIPESIDVDSIIEDIRQELIFATWTDNERALLTELRQGRTIVVTLRGAHNNLIQWAESSGLYVRIDRRSEWGNPFEMPADGDRDTVINNYEQHYLPHKPSLTGKMIELRGKALGCWCAPEPCHGDVLARRSQQ